ncbi:Transposon TX1 uncharacterized protein [Nymphaea thermarum]|nr:Transposon TX1 uncharacterized protein [Nymphaea thermarum]
MECETEGVADEGEKHPNREACAGQKGSSGGYPSRLGRGREEAIPTGMECETEETEAGLNLKIGAGDGRARKVVGGALGADRSTQRRAGRVGGLTLIASRWQPGQELKINAVETVMLFVQLPQLPIHLWNEYCYKGIARATRGEYVEEDSCSGKWEKVGFARVKLEVPIPNPFYVLANNKKIDDLTFPPGFTFESGSSAMGLNLSGAETTGTKTQDKVVRGTHINGCRQKKQRLLLIDSTSPIDKPKLGEGENEWIKTNVVCALSMPPRATSNHKVIMVKMDNPLWQNRNTRRFRVLKPWMLTREGRQVNSEAWGAEVQGCPMLRVLRKLEVVKRSLIYWNKNSFGRIEDNIKSLQSRLRQAQANSEAGDGWATREEESIKRKLEKALHLEEIIKNRISELEVAGQTFSSINSMLEAASSHFESFLNETSANGDILNDFRQGDFVSTEENASLLEPATYAEVKEAVMSLNKDSALGPDGFPNFFYQIMWEEIDQDIWRVVDNFFKTWKLVRSLNKTYLMLIPKKRGARRIEDYSPIALCNSLYKVIAKVMVQRMKNILPRLIGITQGAFVKSRVIHDQIAMANELVHLFDSRKEAIACLKLDISKAYDRVS